MGMSDSSQVLHHPVAHFSFLMPGGLNMKMQKLDRDGHLEGRDLQCSDSNLVQVCDVLRSAALPRRWEKLKSFRCSRYYSLQEYLWRFWCHSPPLLMSEEVYLPPVSSLGKPKCMPESIECLLVEVFLWWMMTKTPKMSKIRLFTFQTCSPRDETVILAFFIILHHLSALPDCVSLFLLPYLFWLWTKLFFKLSNVP